MLVIALCMACFYRAKINKNLWPPTFRFGPPTLNALEPALLKALQMRLFISLYGTHTALRRFNDIVTITV